MNAVKSCFVLLGFLAVCQVIVARPDGSTTVTTTTEKPTLSVKPVHQHLHHQHPPSPIIPLLHLLDPAYWAVLFTRVLATTHRLLHTASKPIHDELIVIEEVNHDESNHNSEATKEEESTNQDEGNELDNAIIPEHGSSLSDRDYDDVMHGPRRKREAENQQVMPETPKRGRTKYMRKRKQGKSLAHLSETPRDHLDQQPSIIIMDNDYNDNDDSDNMKNSQSSIIIMSGNEDRSGNIEQPGEGINNDLQMMKQSNILLDVTDDLVHDKSESMMIIAGSTKEKSNPMMIKNNNLKNEEQEPMMISSSDGRDSSEASAESISEAIAIKMPKGKKVNTRSEDVNSSYKRAMNVKRSTLSKLIPLEHRSIFR